MKNFELRKLLSEYKKIKVRQKKKNADTYNLSRKLKEIEHRYYHETGRTLKSDLVNFK